MLKWQVGRFHTCSFEVFFGKWKWSLSLESPCKLIRPCDSISIVIKVHLFPALLVDSMSSAYLSFFLNDASSKRVSKGMVNSNRVTSLSFSLSFFSPLSLSRFSPLSFSPLSFSSLSLSPERDQALPAWLTVKEACFWPIKFRDECGVHFDANSHTRSCMHTKHSIYRRLFLEC